MSVELTAEQQISLERWKLAERRKEEHRRALRQEYNGTPEYLATLVESERLRRYAKRAVDGEEAPPAAIPMPQSLAERLAKPPRPLVWRINGLMQANHRVLLSAQSKAGKTTTVVNVVRALVDTRALLFDLFHVEPVNRVTILDFEMADDDPGQLDDWYRDAKLDHPERVQIVPVRGRASAFNILDPAYRQRSRKR
jgi:hypothetical protein